MDSILTSIKKLLGIVEECEDFDVDIIIHINTVLVILNQLGVGDKVFSIEDKTTTWQDYLGEKYKDLSFIKTYIGQKVRLLFDPPSGAVLEALNNSITELEFRINVAVDTGEIVPSEIGKYVTKAELDAAVSGINTRIDNAFNVLDEEIGGDG